MSELNEVHERTAREKATYRKIINYLNEEGYATYARRLQNYRLVLASMVGNHYIKVACMLPDTGDIYVNPAMLDLYGVGYGVRDEKKKIAKLWEQLSVVIRHELLHFLLNHQERMLKYLQKKDPEFLKKYSQPTLHDLANVAEDYEISNRGYDQHDKEVVRTLTVNGRVIGGLIAEDKDSWHTEDWGGLSFETMYEKLLTEHEKRMADKAANAPTLHVKRIDHSQEYRDMYNKVMAKYDDPSVPDADIAALIAGIHDGTVQNI